MQYVCSPSGDRWSICRLGTSTHYMFQDKQADKKTIRHEDEGLNISPIGLHLALGPTWHAFWSCLVCLVGRGPLATHP